MTQSGSINFSLLLVDSLHLHLKGTIESYVDGVFTIINIRRLEQTTGSLLPPIRIKKKEGQWVHIDSDKETDLSVAIGHAIDIR
jgi:hypothetical protein